LTTVKPVGLLRNHARVTVTSLQMASEKSVACGIL
jgi:hypothetical protein